LAKFETLENENLVCELYWAIVQVVHETNSKRGLSKKSSKHEQDLLQELCNRFNLDADKLEKLINPE
jgi:hypothetical protein